MWRRGQFLAMVVRIGQTLLSPSLLSEVYRKAKAITQRYMLKSSVSPHNATHSLTSTYQILQSLFRSILESFPDRYIHAFTHVRNNLKNYAWNSIPRDVFTCIWSYIMTTVQCHMVLTARGCLYARPTMFASRYVQEHRVACTHTH